MNWCFIPCHGGIEYTCNSSELIMKVAHQSFTPCFLSFWRSARQKIDEDLQDLERQIKLQSGEPVPASEDRPAKAFMNTAMVSASPCHLPQSKLHCSVYVPAFWAVWMLRVNSLVEPHDACWPEKYTSLANISAGRLCTASELSSLGRGHVGLLFTNEKRVVNSFWAADPETHKTISKISGHKRAHTCLQRLYFPVLHTTLLLSVLCILVDFVFLPHTKVKVKA